MKSVCRKPRYLILYSQKVGEHMAYERVKTLKDTSKSQVFLIYDDETSRMMVEKHLNGRLDVYERLMKLSHPYLPKLHRVVFEQGHTIIWEEYIDGNSLAQINGTQAQLSQWLLELCDVLSFLHKHQIIHRDIKPSNLLLGIDGHIRLIDFDAAREQKESAEQDTRLLGTKGYAPPEQYGFAQTDQRADIYAIGVTWKALLGQWGEKQPYRSILRKCTDLNPKKRYGSVAALAFAWRTRTIRRFLPLVVCGAAVLVGVMGWNAYQDHQAEKVEISKVSYPEEALLLRTLEGEHILAQTDALFYDGEIHTMEVDLNRDGKRETIKLQAEMGSDQPEIVILNGDDVICVTDPSKLLGADFPVGQYMGQGDGSYTWYAESSDYTQITCLDLDPLVHENTGPELLVTIGDGGDHVVSAVFSYDGTLGMPLVYRGFMWGSTFVKQNEAGSFEAYLDHNPYMDYNLYYYAFDELSESMCMDFDEYWSYMDGWSI